LSAVRFRVERSVRVDGNKRPARSFALGEGVRIFRGVEEMRFRKGVWSYTEAIVRLAGQGERAARYFGTVHERLARGLDADADAIADEVGADEDERESFRGILDDLKRQQFLRDPAERDAARVVAALLGGNLSGFGEYVDSPRPVLFFSDSPYARGAARAIAGEIGLPLDFLDDETARGLAEADLTTRTDAVAHAESMARLGAPLRPYSCVLGCVASPALSSLRNLNRLLVQAEKPMVLGMIDGPFLTVLSTLATQTGCFECFEQRMLARLEDTEVYHRFAGSAAGGPAVGPGFAPALHLLTAAVLSEGYLFSTLGMLRLAGRVVNTYLPILEIQVQDLLRVPYCPACGFIAKARMNEMYTSSKRLVSQMLARLDVVED
jgi:thiazole/oxazole-forming peptide maturase SagC family component